MWIFTKNVEGNLANIPSDDYVNLFTLSGFMEVIEGGELAFYLEGEYRFKKHGKSGCIL